MKTITDTEREVKFENSSESVRRLYSSPVSGEVLSRVFEEEKLNEELYRTFSLTVGDIMLGFFSKEELPGLLVERMAIPENVAQRITTKLGSLLQNQHPGSAIPKAEAGVKEELELRPQGVPRPEPQKREEEVPKPLTREDVLSALASRRTMASDIESVKKSEENKDE